MATWNALYLGIQTQIDPTEGNTLAENAGALVGQTFGGPGDALAGDQVSITTYNGGGSSTALDQNNTNGSWDWVYTDLGNGGQWYRFDAAVAYDATITYLDGTTTTGRLVLFQTTTGETFLAPGILPGANNPLLAGPIRSVTLDSLAVGSATGLQIDRPTFDFVACFARGTLIETEDGPRYVETLKAGDRVWTRDEGLQPLIWTGGRVVDGHGALAPVRIRAGAMGNLRDLVVSPQHRMLIEGWQAELHFGGEEVLVAAKALVNGRTVVQDPVDQVSYHHLLFDRHQIVTAEGIASESFHPGRNLLQADRAIHAELLTIFPELAHPEFEAPWPTARPVIKPVEARVLAA